MARALALLNGKEAFLGFVCAHRSNESAMPFAARSKRTSSTGSFGRRIRSLIGRVLRIIGGAALGGTAKFATSCKRMEEPPCSRAAKFAGEKKPPEGGFVSATQRRHAFKANAPSHIVIELAAQRGICLIVHGGNLSWNRAARNRHERVLVRRAKLL
jgi:hypothetical protein